MSGRGASERAMATRWRMPPESWPGRWPATAARPMIPTSSSTRSAMSALPHPAHSRPNAMLLRTVFHGNSE